jgi:phosphotransferase system HPr-like phosphotransfer protein
MKTKLFATILCLVLSYSAIPNSVYALRPISHRVYVSGVLPNTGNETEEIGSRRNMFRPGSLEHGIDYLIETAKSTIVNRKHRLLQLSDPERNLRQKIDGINIQADFTLEQEAELRRLLSRYFELERLVHRIKGSYVTPGRLKLLSIARGTIFSKGLLRKTLQPLMWSDNGQSNDEIDFLSMFGEGGSPYDEFFDADLVSMTLESFENFDGNIGSGFEDTGLAIVYSRQIEELPMVAIDFPDQVFLKSGLTAFLHYREDRDRHILPEILTLEGIRTLRQEALIKKGIAKTEINTIIAQEPFAPKEVAVTDGVLDKYIEAIVIDDDIFEMAKNILSILPEEKIIRASEYFKDNDRLEEILELKEKIVSITQQACEKTKTSPSGRAVNQAYQETAKDAFSFTHVFKRAGFLLNWYTYYLPKLKKVLQINDEVFSRLINNEKEMDVIISIIDKIQNKYKTVAKEAAPVLTQIIDNCAKLNLDYDLDNLRSINDLEERIRIIQGPIYYRRIGSAACKTLPEVGLVSTEIIRLLFRNLYGYDDISNAASDALISFGKPVINLVREELLNSMKISDDMPLYYTRVYDKRSKDEIDFISRVLNHYNFDRAQYYDTLERHNYRLRLHFRSRLFTILRGLPIPESELEAYFFRMALNDINNPFFLNEVCTREGTNFYPPLDAINNIKDLMYKKIYSKKIDELLKILEILMFESSYFDESIYVGKVISEGFVQNVFDAILTEFFPNKTYAEKGYDGYLDLGLRLYNQEVIKRLENGDMDILIPALEWLIFESGMLKSGMPESGVDIFKFLLRKVPFELMPKLRSRFKEIISGERKPENIEYFTDIFLDGQFTVSFYEKQLKNSNLTWEEQLGIFLKLMSIEDSRLGEYAYSNKYILRTLSGRKDIAEKFIQFFNDSLHDKIKSRMILDKIIAIAESETPLAVMNDSNFGVPYVYLHEFLYVVAQYGNTEDLINMQRIILKKVRESAKTGVDSKDENRIYKDELQKIADLEKDHNDIVVNSSQIAKSWTHFTELVNLWSLSCPDNIALFEVSCNSPETYWTSPHIRTKIAQKTVMEYDFMHHYDQSADVAHNFSFYDEDLSNFQERKETADTPKGMVHFPLYSSKGYISLVNSISQEELKSFIAALLENGTHPNKELILPGAIRKNGLEIPARAYLYQFANILGLDVYVNPAVLTSNENASAQTDVQPEGMEDISSNKWYSIEATVMDKYGIHAKTAGYIKNVMDTNAIGYQVYIIYKGTKTLITDYPALFKLHINKGDKIVISIDPKPRLKVKNLREINKYNDLIYESNVHFRDLANNLKFIFETQQLDEMPTIFKLEDAPNDVEVIGNKALILKRMIEMGIPVPDAFVVRADHDFIGDIKSIVLPHFSEKVSVRSSPRISAPGLLDTVLNVDFNNETIKESITRIRSSANNPGVKEFLRLNDFPEYLPVAVIIQRMVYGDKDVNSGSFVLSVTPLGNKDVAIQIEYTKEKKGDAIVGGQVTARSIEESGIGQQQLSQIREIVMKLQKEFGPYLQIEGTIESGKVYILQCKILEHGQIDSTRINAINEAKVSFDPIIVNTGKTSHATGKLSIISNVSDLPINTQEPCVLAFRHADKEATAILLRVLDNKIPLSGIVTEIGGTQTHFATVVNHFNNLGYNIPYITNVNFSIIEPNSAITLDLTKGSVSVSGPKTSTGGIKDPLIEALGESTVASLPVLPNESTINYLPLTQRARPQSRNIGEELFSAA